MKTGIEVIRELAADKNLRIPNVMTDKFFDQIQLAMVVKCRCCEMTMTFPNCFLDSLGFIYCRSCKEE